MDDGGRGRTWLRRSRAYEASPLAVVQVDAAGAVRDVNAAFARLVGQGAAALPGTPVLDLFAAQDHHLLLVEHAAREAGRDRGVVTCRLLDGDGGTRWVRLSWSMVEDPDGTRWSINYVEDVETEAVQVIVADELLAAVEAERAALNAAMEVVPDGIVILTAERDPDGEVVDARVVRVNRTGSGGRDVAALTGRRLREAFPHAEASGLHAAALDSLRSQQTRRLLLEVPAGSDGGDVRSFETVLAPIDADRALVTFRDVTTARLDEERLLYAATHDALTGLPNRVLLRDRITHALQRADRDGSAVAIAFLDLDGFKTINDTRGHTVGDAVLQQVAARLSRSVREEDTVARLGGDEFVLVLEGCADERAWGPVHDRVAGSLAEPMTVGDQEVSLRASIGVVFAEPGESDAEAVMRNADIAMYAAKRGGKDRWTTFTERHRRDVVDLAALESDLATAVAQQQFELHHQPIHDLRLGRTVGHEALLRWRHPRRGLLLPQAFLPALEAGGWMVEVGEWVVREALQHGALRGPRSPAHAGEELMVTVNVSAQQLLHSDFARTVREALATTGTPPGRLTIEITETQVLPSVADVMAQLHELRAFGVRVAVDDFGTGYSSLSHLADLPVDLVKIDRGFLVDLTDHRREAVLRSAIELSRAVGAQCLVEGVETGAQLDLVRDTSARFAQGFLLGRPAPFTP